MRKEVIDKRLAETYKIVSDNLIRLRGKMTQEELGKRAGISREVVSAIENKKSFNFDSLLKLAWAFNIHPMAFLMPLEERQKFITQYENRDAKTEKRLEGIEQRLKQIEDVLKKHLRTS